MNLKAVILDWAGTTVDHGSRAPVLALQSIFESASVPISVGEARESMGIAKKSHIREVLSIARVREAWRTVHGREAVEAEVEALYEQFIPRQLESLRGCSDVIPGVVKAIAAMRERGLKIGTTTGYNRAMLDYLRARAAQQGFKPDYSLCPDDAPAGRPYPWMCFLNAIHLDVFPMWTMVKIGDTPSDILEGLNAGAWTIGVSRTGNEVGLTLDEWSALGVDEQDRRLQSAGQRLEDAGAHYVAESVADWVPLLDEIEKRLASGEKP